MNVQLLQNGTDKPYDMIVFCHLRWDFVYQRPQHIISRLAKNYKILVVEEPVNYEQGEKSIFSVRQINSQIDICQPRVNRMEDIGPYLKKHLQISDFSAGWFYSAAFIQVLETLDFESVVYDCMDELTLFKGASPQLIEQENQLLAAADVVYTGGKSLYESKRQKHHNVFCFPSSVDFDHFSATGNIKPNDIAEIPSPIVGYYGVIDERIDLVLLEKTAAKSPDSSFVMLGPICKIEEKDLPRAKNIHYLGMKTYDELPAYLEYFDIAMMPFALNDSTKFISPTKTLEYMAAGKPVISTKIKDVERDYSDCVMMITDADDFTKAIKNPIENFEPAYKEILDKTSWDVTAEEMGLMIKKAIA